MCGINGLNRRNPALIEKMNLAIRHRGPDYAGIYLDESASLGHVLLSIRDDPDKSKQPFFDQGSPWILLFNGQLYNTAQIKSQLDASMKHEDLDTRLLYELIKKYGWDFVNRVHGMYAIALYNSQEQQIRLYRDPSG
jgi:asparagine synthase (glutamine-hydrolysing)